MAVGGVDWSLLPNDMVELISKFLTFDPDFIRFRSVCSRWRSAAPNRPQLPWLIGLREDAEGNDEILSFFKLSFQRNHELKILPIPELPESSLFDRMACRGSSHGWTVLLDFAAPSIVLWNPVTKSKIQLPTLPLFDVGHGDLRKYARIGERRYASVLIHPSAGVRFFKVKLSAIEEYFASQVVLSSVPAVSSTDCVALAVCGEYKHLVFCSIGDEAWTPIHCPPAFDGWKAKAVFYEGKFYVATRGHVYVCNFGLIPRVELVASVSPQCAGFDPIDESHLVESDGDLLLVLALRPDKFTHKKARYQFKIFKTVWGKQVDLVEVRSLDDRALFLDHSHSLSLAASLFSRCRANRIYYNEIDYTKGRVGAKQLSVCDFEDGSIVSILAHGAFPHLDWEPYLWFWPSFLPQGLGIK